LPLKTTDVIVTPGPYEGWR